MSRAQHAVTWHASGSLAGAVIVGVVVLGTGLVASRPDLACLALPLMVWAAWSWQGRPRGETQTECVIETAHRVAGKSPRLTAVLRVSRDELTEFVHARMLVGGTHRRNAVLDGRSEAPLSAIVPARHSGPCEVLALRYRLASADGAFIADPTPQQQAERIIRPQIVPLPQLLLPQRLHGLTGTHGSTRPGDGGSFRDIALFAPGDRLRRIDWKATARLARRPGDLYVRRSFATSDATAVIVMDTGDELGEVVAEWTRGRVDKTGMTSMDAAREAAAAIAVAYTQSGDQVALQNLALGSRQVRRGSGDRHRERLLATIAATRPHGVGMTHRRAPLVAAGALVYVLSTFFDGEAATLAAMWSAVGHRVLAVDTLPPGNRAGLTPEQATAHTIVMMEREDRLRDMEAAGVRIVRWADAAGLPSRNAQFSALARERAR